MAHPARRDWATPLARKIADDANRAVHIAWDRVGDCWETSRRAWLTFDPEATHHVVIQDDAVVCRDLVAGIEKALTFIPGDGIISLYVGTRRPTVNSVNRAVRDAEQLGVSWIKMTGLQWGVGVVVPTRVIHDMVAWCDTERVKGDDNKMRRFFTTQLRWPTWCTWPSLVDHRQIPSILHHPAGRYAHRFIGEDVSALTADYGRGCVIMDQPSMTRTRSIRRR